MIVGIFVDNWKLPIFKKHLDSANLLYTENSITEGATMIKVSCNTIEGISMLIMTAEKECANIRCPSCED